MSLNGWEQDRIRGIELALKGALLLIQESQVGKPPLKVKDQEIQQAIDRILGVPSSQDEKARE